MKSPLSAGEQWLELEEVETTQTVASKCLLEGDEIGIVYAHEQTAGKGRFDRVWVSRRDDSLTFSLIFRAYANHPKPYLIGMAAGLAVAGAIRCQLRWPNDLVFGEKKVGGILTQLMPDAQGRLVPVVGIGLNLNQEVFPPEIAEFATSLKLARGGQTDPQMIAHRIIERFASLPEPEKWSDLLPIWDLYDFTPGKKYRLPTGEVAIALGIGSDAQLLCSVDGESRSIMAAEALFGGAAE